MELMVTDQIQQELCHDRTRMRFSFIEKVKLAAGNVLCNAAHEKRRSTLFVVDVVEYSSKKSRLFHGKGSDRVLLDSLLFQVVEVVRLFAAFSTLVTVEFDVLYRTDFKVFF